MQWSHSRTGPDDAVGDHRDDLFAGVGNELGAHRWGGAVNRSQRGSLRSRLGFQYHSGRPVVIFSGSAPNGNPRDTHRIAIASDCYTMAK